MFSSGFNVYRRSRFQTIGGTTRILGGGFLIKDVNRQSRFQMIGGRTRGFGRNSSDLDIIHRSGFQTIGGITIILGGDSSSEDINRRSRLRMIGGRTRRFGRNSSGLGMNRRSRFQTTGGGTRILDEDFANAATHRIILTLPKKPKVNLDYPTKVWLTKAERLPWQSHRPKSYLFPRLSLPPSMSNLPLLRLSLQSEWRMIRCRMSSLVVDVVVSEIP